eukprot:6184020-Pleurochrysis_carterae.AAC.4
MCVRSCVRSCVRACRARARACTLCVCARAFTLQCVTCGLVFALLRRIRRKRRRPYVRAAAPAHGTSHGTARVRGAHYTKASFASHRSASLTATASLASLASSQAGQPLAAEECDGYDDESDVLSYTTVQVQVGMRTRDACAAASSRFAHFRGISGQA